MGCIRKPSFITYAAGAELGNPLLKQQSLINYSLPAEVCQAKQCYRRWSNLCSLCIAAVSHLDDRLCPIRLWPSNNHQLVVVTYNPSLPICTFDFYKPVALNLLNSIKEKEIQLNPQPVQLLTAYRHLGNKSNHLPSALLNKLPAVAVSP